MSVEQEQAQAQQKAAAAQKKYDEVGNAEYMRTRPSWYPVETVDPRAAAGTWEFIELKNEPGQGATPKTIGWRVQLNGKIIGLVVNGADGPVLLCTSRDEDPSALNALDIMAALQKALGR